MATLSPYHAQFTIPKKRVYHSIFRAMGMVPLIGEQICKSLASAAGKRTVEEETNAADGKGIAAFSKAAKRMMERRESGMIQLPGVLARSRLSAYYAKKTAQACIKFGCVHHEALLMRLVTHISGYSKVGLYCVPSPITDYERIWGSTLPKNFLKILRECYPDFSAAFLKKYDDGSDEFLRAIDMLRYQQVAFDGIGSFSSPSYPLFDKSGKRMRSSALALEIQLTKLTEAFCAVLYKQMRPDLSDADDPRNTELAAAAMIAVSGKDVNPDLCAVLLSVLFPPSPLEFTREVVDRLHHPIPADLENLRGEDMRYAKEAVMPNRLFRMLVEIREQSRIERIELLENMKQKALDEFVCQTTQLDWPDDTSADFSEDTVPSFAVKAPCGR